MKKEQTITQPPPKKTILNSGKIYFNGKTERKFYFALTLFMLIAGLLSKAGLF